jgi:hypothetical protein
MLKTQQTRQEREWLLRNRHASRQYKIHTKTSDNLSMPSTPNLSTVPLFINQQNEIHSLRYACDTNTMCLGTQTKYTTICGVLLFKLKKGYIVCLTQNGVQYIYYQSTKTTSLAFDNQNIVLVDGLWDTCTNTCTTVTCDTWNVYNIRVNEHVVRTIQCMDMIDMISLCGLHVSWNTIESNTKIYDVTFLSCNGRWLIESSDYIYILDPYGYQMFMENTTEVTNMLLNDTYTFDGMIYDYDGNDIYVSNTHGILMYQKNGYLFIAQTIHPYHIKHVCYGNVLPRIHRWYDNLNNQDIIIETIDGIYKLSMDPKSLTASTSMDTTLA